MSVSEFRERALAALDEVRFGGFMRPSLKEKDDCIWFINKTNDARMELAMMETSPLRIPFTFDGRDYNLMFVNGVWVSEKNHDD